LNIQSIRCFILIYANSNSATSLICYDFCDLSRFDSCGLRIVAHRLPRHELEWCEAPEVVARRGLALRSRLLRPYHRTWSLAEGIDAADDPDAIQIRPTSGSTPRLLVADGDGPATASQ